MPHIHLGLISFFYHPPDELLAAADEERLPKLPRKYDVASFLLWHAWKSYTALVSSPTRQILKPFDFLCTYNTHGEGSKAVLLLGAGLARLAAYARRRKEE
jgi:hypothetical protein